MFILNKKKKIELKLFELIVYQFIKKYIEKRIAKLIFGIFSKKLEPKRGLLKPQFGSILFWHSVVKDSLSVGMTQSADLWRIRTVL